MKTDWLHPDQARALLDDNTTAFRICDAKGEWVERFGETALISLREEKQLEAFREGLEKFAEQTGWNHRRVFLRRLIRAPGSMDVPEPISGGTSSPPCEVVLENGRKFEVDFSASYSPGLFCDQRHNRRRLMEFQPSRVLNTFSYTCAFSVAAASVGAATTSVDVSKGALQRGRKNFEWNNLSVESHRFVPEDVMTYLARLEKRGEQFDAIILDPPTFGRDGAGRVFRVEKDFSLLLQRAARIAAPGCRILLSTNFSQWTPRYLEAQARGVFPPGTQYDSAPQQPDFPRGQGSATLWAHLP